MSFIYWLLIDTRYQYRCSSTRLRSKSIKLFIHSKTHTRPIHYIIHSIQNVILRDKTKNNVFYNETPCSRKLIWKRAKYQSKFPSHLICISYCKFDYFVNTKFKRWKKENGWSSEMILSICHLETRCKQGVPHFSVQTLLLCSTGKNKIEILCSEKL